MAILLGDSASYLYIGTLAGRPDPTNLGPNTIARAYTTDPPQFWTWARDAWIAEAMPQAPAIPPGPMTDQLACNVANFLIKTVFRQTVAAGVTTVASTTVFKGLILLVIGAIPGLDLLDPEVAAILFPFVETFIPAALGQFTGSLAADALWNTLGCTVYTVIRTINTWDQTALATIGTAVEGVTSAFPDVVRAIGQSIAGMALPVFRSLVAAAALLDADCSQCLISPSGPILGPAQFAGALEVDDGVTAVRNVRRLQFDNASVSGDADDAVVTIPPGNLGTVTSVDVTGNALFAITGGPITSSGALNLDFEPEGAHEALLGPLSGSAIPTFRHIESVDLAPSPTDGAVLASESGVGAWVTNVGPLEVTDGTHDLTGVKKITVSGATVGGTAPNATLSYSPTGTPIFWRAGESGDEAGTSTGDILGGSSPFTLPADLKHIVAHVACTPHASPPGAYAWQFNHDTAAHYWWTRTVFSPGATLTTASGSADTQIVFLPIDGPTRLEIHFNFTRGGPLFVHWTATGLDSDGVTLIHAIGAGYWTGGDGLAILSEKVTNLSYGTDYWVITEPN